MCDYICNVLAAVYLLLYSAAATGRCCHQVEAGQATVAGPPPSHRIHSESPAIDMDMSDLLTAASPACSSSTNLISRSSSASELAPRPAAALQHSMQEWYSVPPRAGGSDVIRQEGKGCYIARRCCTRGWLTFPGGHPASGCGPVLWPALRPRPRACPGATVQGVHSMRVRGEEAPERMTGSGGKVSMRSNACYTPGRRHGHG